jgi:hypothetical protein
MTMLVDALLLFVLFVAWGAQATVPWQLSGTRAAGTDDDAPRADAAAGGGAPSRRRLWRAGALPLALAGLLAAYELADRNPDAAIATGLVPLLASVPGRLLAVLVPALLVAALLGGLGGARLGVTGERLAAALGLAACTAAAWAGELLRAGEGPESSEPRFLLLIGCRLALMLAAGELPLLIARISHAGSSRGAANGPGSKAREGRTPEAYSKYVEEVQPSATPETGPFPVPQQKRHEKCGLARPRWAAAGGGALLLYLPLLPEPLRAVLWSQGLQLTCGAGALLLLAVRWLPRALRLPAFATGLLLAAIVLSQAGRVSQALAPGIDYEEFPALR